MFEHILAALDGSSHDTRTLAATKELAKLGAGQVRVVHVRKGHFIGRAGFVPSEEGTSCLLQSWGEQAVTIAPGRTSRGGRYCFHALDAGLWGRR